MADGATVSGIEKLDGKNYPTWRFKMQIVMKAKQLWSVIENDPPNAVAAQDAKDAWTEKDQTAQSLIVQTVNTSQASLIMNQSTAKDMWRRLEQSNRGKITQQVLNMKHELSHIRWEKGEDAAAYLQRVEELTESLRSMGHEIQDVEVASIAIRGLPRSYGSVADAFNMAAEHDVTVERLRHAIIDAERRQRRDNEARDMAFKAKINKGSYRDRNSGIRCFRCKKVGHTAKECYSKYDADNHLIQDGKGTPQKGEKVNKYEKNKMGKTNDQKRNCAFHAYANEANCDSKQLGNWTIDSGASRHMTGDRNLVRNFIEDNGKLVTFANGETREAVGNGIVKFSPEVKSSFDEIEATDVLLVPGLKDNLISVAKLTDSGLDVIFTRDTCEVTREGQLVFSAQKENGLYHMNSDVDIDIEYANATSEFMLKIWHERLCHVNFDTLRKMYNMNLLPCLNIKSNVNSYPCEECFQGKHSSTPFPKTTREHCKEVLELLHMDLCGPFPVDSIGGNRYIFLIVDDYSRRMKVIFLKAKSEVPDAFRDFVTEAENQINKTLKRIRFDNGGEFISHALEEYLKSKGIVHEKTIPYTPQQNSVAERGLRTIVEMARTMLIQSGLDLRYWAEAVQTAVYTRNRIIVEKTGDQSPEEKWTNRKRVVSYFKVFGCAAYAWVPEQHRHKLSPKSKVMIFLGYWDDRKGYRLYDPDKRCIVASRDVKFSEGKRAIDVFENEKSKDSDITFAYPEIEKSVENQTQDSSVNPINELEFQGDELEITNSRDREQPNESSLRRSSRRRQAPDRLILKPNQQTYCENVQLNLTEPTTLAQAMQSENKEQWEKAMETELSSHEQMGTWELVPRDESMNVLKSKWVFKIKKTQDGKIDRFKARLVALGFKQQPGKDYEESYSPVVRLETLRTLLAIAETENLIMRQYDVETAYLHGNLKEEIYMETPPGTSTDQNYVCKLRKAIYGLKQSGREWYKTLDEYLCSQGFTRCESDRCVYILKDENECLILAIYVDDILALSTSQEFLENNMKKLASKFKLKDLGIPNQILGLEISRDEQNRMKVGQSKYIEELLHKYGMQDCKPVSTPIDISQKEETMSDNEEINVPYQELMGSLMYLVQGTRPDIAFAVHYLCRFTTKYTKHHWTMAKRVLRYLQGTKHLGLTYEHSGSGLEGYTDASWNSWTDDGRSTTGYVYKLSQGAIVWNSSKQTMIAQSTCEAEYIALSECVKTGMWLNDLLTELNCNHLIPSSIPIGIDNSAAKAFVENGVQTKRTRHIRLKYLFVKKEIEDGHFTLHYVPTDFMTADILTKPVTLLKHEFCVTQLGLT